MGWYYSHGLIIILYRVVIRLHTYVHTYHRATSCLQSLAQDLQYLVSKNERGGRGRGRRRVNMEERTAREMKERGDKSEVYLSRSVETGFEECKHGLECRRTHFMRVMVSI